jgi:hypothetical protein
MTDRVVQMEAVVSREGLFPNWQSLLQEATEALVRMDANRLEELARCCEDLNRKMQSDCEDSVQAQKEALRGMTSEISAQKASLAVMSRLLEETRANLRVLTRLHILRLKAAAGGIPDFDLWHSHAAGVEYGDN